MQTFTGSIKPSYRVHILQTMLGKTNMYNILYFSIKTKLLKIELLVS
jgi:hypothetical protein